MPKNIEDIIVPERKRSIRNIPIPEGRKKDGGNSAPFASNEYYPPATRRESGVIRQEEKKFSTSSWRDRKSVWITTGAAVIALIFTILSIFNGATLAYTPKSMALSFNNEIYTAKKSGEGELLYSVIKLSGDKGLEVPASGEETVSRKANGTIVVYNDAATLPQRLVENTRFETPNGLVYRVPNAFVIPGKKTVSGKTQPGSVEIVVHADVAGDKYNIGLTDFTLPGLKGSARFTTIYARSKTAMSGGFVGMEKVVKSEDKARAKAELETALRNELLSLAKAQAPEDFILFPSLSSVTFEDLPQTDSTNKNSAKFNLRANLFGVMFKRSDLSNHLSLKKITPTAGESIDIPALDSLNLAFADTAPLDLLLSKEIKLSVTGSVTAVWRTDEVALKSDLIGKRNKEIPSILKNYPTIVSATANIRPFWKSSFPSDAMRITIKKLPVK